ncbi:MAG: chemotaxis response regulator protein-glutamate methylesterase [Spirochaetes bacterium]|nr:chemotaxis response regulator protein-glutamate methylesterase [Spirochaetota bacterium]MBN2770449.1 chemotaxis response regulator protein-glutamate methylesterase [Spirochaetota bacterium]
MDKIRVLVVDDSALVRRIISDALEKDPEIEVVGTANNGKNAIFKSFVLYPDVITMDIEMPVMDGLEALREIMDKNAKPVIMLSSLTQYGAEATFKALEYGAADFVPKPQAMVQMSFDEISEQLVQKVKAYAKAEINYSAVSLKDKVVVPKAEEKIFDDIALDKHYEHSKKRIVAIGTSTGGPSALIKIFERLPANLSCPVMVVQHMPPGFTKAFAERLNALSPLSVKEAEDGDILRSGWAYVAPGHSHMELVQRNGVDTISLNQNDKVSGHRPSIDVMFRSIARVYSSDVTAVIMTGMGRDGASGLLELSQKGSYTIAQDRATSVVFGMNRAAIEMGAVKNIVPLDEISKKIVEHL